MPRRQQDISFGSDAFLDVVANIVGILIILMVVAGVKVGRAPVNVARSEPASAEVVAPSVATISDRARVIESDAESPPPVEEAATASNEPPPESPAPLPDVAATPLPAAAEEEIPLLPPAEPPAELVQRAQSLERDVEQLKRQLALAKRAADHQRDLKQKAEDEHSRRKNEALAAVEALQSARSELSRLEQNILARKRQYDQLHQHVERERSAADRVQSVEHRLTPIGQAVEGDEMHFRLTGNRVSYVPVMELAAQVQQDIERRKEVLLSRSFYKGTVGPLDGYRMEYLIQRQSLSIADELRFGHGIVRMLVTNWVILPETYLVTESAEEALQTGSRFVAALQKAQPGTTITFWVYPDSFEIHRRLKEVVHETGFRVAARPLPEGVPIAGSPEGTKSVSQ